MTFHALWLSGFLAVTAPLPAIPPTDAFVVHADDWSRPRSGARVAALPELRAAMAALVRRPDATLTIVHPAGEAGQWWGAELRDWLVALGAEPARLRVATGDARADAILLRVETPR